MPDDAISPKDWNVGPGMQKLTKYVLVYNVIVGW